MAIRGKCLTVGLISAVSPSAKPGKMAEEDSSSNLLKEILTQVQVLKPIQHHLAELKCCLKEMQKKKSYNEDRLNAREKITQASHNILCKQNYLFKITIS